jgi:hypothetical protein
MREHNWIARAGVFTLLLVFLAGLLSLAHFTSRNSYPPFSSMSSDPKGTKLLFDSLSATGKVAVNRNYLPISDLHARNTLIFFLGVSPETLEAADDKMLAGLEALAQDRNLLAIGVTNNAFLTREDQKKKTVLEKRWGVSIKSSKSHAELTADTTWHPSSTGAFEKNMGRGVILLLLNPQRLNNETLASNAHSRALASALLAGESNVVFEETHLGLEESGSIAGLARRYRLQGLIAGVLIIAALFVWNRSVSFPPPNSFEQKTDSLVAGADARSMFAGLLSRHLPAESLIGACVAEWNRVRPDRRITEYQVTKNSPLEAYIRIQVGLREKNTPKT